MDDKLRTNAEKLSFILSELNHICSSQRDMYQKVNDIHEVIYVRRNGKPPLAQHIDLLEERTTILEQQNKTKSNRRWDVVKSFLASLIGASIALFFYYFFGVKI